MYVFFGLCVHCTEHEWRASESCSTVFLRGKDDEHIYAELLIFHDGGMLLDVLDDLNKEQMERKRIEREWKEEEDKEN